MLETLTSKKMWIMAWCLFCWILLLAFCYFKNMATIELMQSFMWLLFWLSGIGMGANIFEKLIPTLPDIIGKVFRVKSDVKLTEVKPV